MQLNYFVLLCMGWNAEAWHCIINILDVCGRSVIVNIYLFLLLFKIIMGLVDVQEVSAVL